MPRTWSLVLTSRNPARLVAQERVQRSSGHGPGMDARPTEATRKYSLGSSWCPSVLQKQALLDRQGNHGRPGSGAARRA